jgi:peptidoglycan-binding protein ArfA
VAGSDKTPATTEWRRASKLYRRPVGVSWLIGLVVIPLLLAAIGYGAFDRSRSEANGPTGALPTLTETSPRTAPPTAPKVPGLSLAPLSITRNGNDIILSGDFTDEAGKSALVNALKSSMAPDVKIIDMLGINPNIDALDFSDAEWVFDAAASIPDFSFTVKGDTITLNGTAASADQQDAVETEAEDAWPNLNIVDKMEIRAPLSPTGTPGLTPVPGPPGPGGPGGACANLQAEIGRVIGGPITFATNDFLLTPADEQRLARVADKLKACPGTKLSINGYTDNVGDDAINIPLSANRANAVADFLIAQGVTRDRLIAKGLGSADPIASNDTSDGRAKNRRVEIVVS